MSESKLRDRSLVFAVSIINLIKDLKSKHESIICNQIGRSGTSIGANILEAQYAHGKPDFIAKLQIALKEANETGYWLELSSFSPLFLPATPPGGWCWRGGLSILPGGVAYSTAELCGAPLLRSIPIRVFRSNSKLYTKRGSCRLRGRIPRLSKNYAFAERLSSGGARGGRRGPPRMRSKAGELPLRGNSCCFQPAG